MREGTVKQLGVRRHGQNRGSPGWSLSTDGLFRECGVPGPAEINLGLFAQLYGHWALKAPLPGLRHGSTFYVSILDYSDYSLLPLLSMGQL